jgi:hypothetical protein
LKQEVSKYEDKRSYEGHRASGKHNPVL